MDVAPHPHIGLQTVSWVIAGEVLHRDTLGLEAMARPGSVNVMTAGRGIAHAEETPRGAHGTLDGVQLWIALSDADRHGDAAFEHVANVPRGEPPGAIVQTFVRGPGIIGSDIEVHRGESTSCDLDPSFEYGLFVLDGAPELEGQLLDRNTLYYMPPGRSDLMLRTRDHARVLLLGGVPFPEKILMWWNFVARMPEEIAEARRAWEEHRFGEVAGYDGPRIEAPSLGRLADPNPAS